jgi:hypothetical protein
MTTICLPELTREFSLHPREGVLRQESMDVRDVVGG